MSDYASKLLYKNHGTIFTNEDGTRFVDWETAMKSLLHEETITKKQDAKAESVVIWSGEHQAYWRDDACGYTTSLIDAGVYSRNEALYLTENCGPEKQIQLITI